MNYGTAELEISNRLNAKFTENNLSNLYEAAAMPETEMEFDEFYKKFTKARAAVQYVDSVYQPSNATGIVNQTETARFRLTFEARKLRGAGGLYTLIQLVKLFLIGFKPSDCEGLTVAKYGLLEFEQNKWQPYLEFECKCVNVQAVPIDEIVVVNPVKKILIDHEFLNTRNFSDEFTNEFGT